MSYSSLPVGGSGDPEGSSAAIQTAAPSASLWFSSSCQMMELESGTFSASGIPDPVTATLAGPGSWMWTHNEVKNDGLKKVAHDPDLWTFVLWGGLPGRWQAQLCVSSSGSVCWFGGRQSAVHSTCRCVRAQTHMPKDFWISDISIQPCDNPSVIISGQITHWWSPYSLLWCSTPGRVWWCTASSSGPSWALHQWRLYTGSCWLCPEGACLARKDTIWKNEQRHLQIFGYLYTV